MSNPPPAPPPPDDPAGPDGVAPMSGQPWSTPTGDPLGSAPPGPPAAPHPTQPLPTGSPSAYPAFLPGHASPPPPGWEPPEYTSPFTAQPGYGPPPPYGPEQPGWEQPGPPPPPPRRSNAPLIAVVLAVTVLLCGGAVTAGVLVVNRVTDRAKEAIAPITDPTLPALPTEAPDLPGLPTDLPGLPTDLPSLPTDLPGLPGTGGTITVVYEVTGDGPAEIVWTEKIGDSPERATDVKLPWKLETTVQSPALVSVTALRSAADAGSISCRATVDGEEVAQRTRDGSFATVSCLKMVLN